MKVKTLHYSAGEAEQASGRTIENQRNDRRKGFDPKVGRPARYDLRAICRFRLRQIFADFGLGPAASLQFLDEATEHLFAAIIRNPAVWTEAAHDLTMPKMPEGEAAGSVSKRLREALVPDDFRRRFHCPASALDDAKEQLGVDPAAIAGTMGLLVMPATGEFRFSRTWFKDFGEFGPADPALHGPVISLAFWPASHGLARRLPRPILDLIPDDMAVEDDPKN